MTPITRTAAIFRSPSGTRSTSTIPTHWKQILLVHHLRELIAGRAVEIPVYDFATHSRKKPGVMKNPAQVIILEGILLFCERELRDLMDIKIFVETATTCDSSAG